jgi:hypothetical protein
MEKAVRNALSSSSLPTDSALVAAIADEELSGHTISVDEMYQSLRASGFSIYLSNGGELSTGQFVEVLQETLGAARESGAENLGWEIALGHVGDPAQLNAQTKLSPTASALVALSWASAVESTSVKTDGHSVTARMPLKGPSKAGIGTISTVVGGALWWGAAIIAGGGTAAVAIVSAPALLAVAGGLAIGIGAYMVVSGFVEATDDLNSVVTGANDSGDLVVGYSVEVVLDKLNEMEEGIEDPPGNGGDCDSIWLSCCNGCTNCGSSCSTDNGGDAYKQCLCACSKKYPLCMQDGGCAGYSPTGSGCPASAAHGLFCD